MPTDDAQSASSSAKATAERNLSDNEHLEFISDPREAASAKSVLQTLYPDATPDRRKNRIPWSAAEEQNLLEGYARFGPSRWKQILESYTFHTSRNSVDLKDKFRNLKKQQERKPHANYRIVDVIRKDPKDGKGNLYRYSYAPSNWQAPRNEGSNWKQVLEEFRITLAEKSSIVDEELAEYEAITQSLEAAGEIVRRVPAVVITSQLGQDESCFFETSQPSSQPEAELPLEAPPIDEEISAIQPPPSGATKKDRNDAMTKKFKSMNQ